MRQVLADAELKIVLEPQATITLTSKPPGAMVSRAGQNLGETPLKFTSDPDVPVRLEFSLKGHARKELDIIPRDGAEQQIELVRHSTKDDSPFKTKAQR